MEEKVLVDTKIGNVGHAGVSFKDGALVGGGEVALLNGVVMVDLNLKIPAGAAIDLIFAEVEKITPAGGFGDAIDKALEMAKPFLKSTLGV